ncbi:MULTISPECIES: rod shape-determining protein RodA [unclassified Flavobacterium]|jgi:rod shape determining protein RodA|uniref:rod shape-determining protein RodA n=1 Tax=unclassified Flavobacterium TaxID=196869 RepID=UPI0007109709|nr:MULTISPECIES: rod shape-determining protein RodA [unclassified Flavobacterium]KRD60058.1 rod shape-determining protein RodA [Flavobacterium sp. Root935]MDQ1163999.1 rod shape determining protein RodA [Flavobacterium sp. SORGH_AS_0622]TDX13915.1 rod shape determining protein RodA [Flavobacterium sp. S87F.05.LMB.W.Kidney.N]BDU24561.1 rod shape-determining protein RodA [Flavobacterium sp. GSB-24]
MKNQSVKNNIDWISVFIYIALVTLGWLNIYSSSLLSTDGTYQKQLIFICCTIPLIFIVLFVDGKFYEKYASIIFGVSLLSLAGLFLFGKTIAGQRCWYAIGSFTLQPSEFAKAATSLALAKYLSDTQINLKETNRQIQALAIMLLPVILILPQPDPGSALIYSVFILVLYREGLPSWYVWTAFITIVLFVLTLVLEPYVVVIIAFVVLAIIHFKGRAVDRNIILSAILLALISGFVFSVDYVFDNVFKQHHRDRFNILLGKSVDMKGIGYNTNQSEIAIGSGGWIGKGFLEGTQTKGGFVPEQHTDYIFTTVGEEWGFAGSLTVIALFVGLLLRVIYLAERQKTKFSRVYGYCVAGILFIHFFVNIAMVIGIFPTIGVPLPFFSYGGSGLWGFTILLFIFLKMDANKVNEW